VPASRLREQLGALHEAGYALVGLSEALTLSRREPGALIAALTFDDGFRDFRREGLDVLREFGASATLYQAVAHTGHPATWLGAGGADLPPLMTWCDLAEVEAAGIEIGSHGYVHHPLDVLPSRQIIDEVQRARDTLERHLNKPVRSFAYPHGYSTRRVRQAVYAVGHENACEAGHRLYRLGGDPMAIPRLPITADHSGPDTLRLVETGGPRLEPLAREAVGPVWRAARWLALRGFGRHIA
jgi:peptidoglycan/xylan/chitin deacetylase (PgdA/CDA1 family)